MLFADMARGDGEDIAVRDAMQPKAEAEIAFILGRDLDAEQLTLADLHRSIEYAVPAIEIVGSRIAKWEIKITDTIADNASSGLYVLGSRPARLTDFDPRLCGMVMEKAGEQVSAGTGAACMGSPLNASLWLAKVMAKAGYPLRAGDTILPGRWGQWSAFRLGMCSMRASKASEPCGRHRQGVKSGENQGARSSVRAISAPI